MNKKHLVAFAAATLASGSTIFAADHLDAPNVGNDGRTDINDLFAFQSLENSLNTVLALTVNPGAGAISGFTLSETATYNFNIDNDGDSLADVIYQATFSGTGLQQSYNITRTAGGVTSPYAMGTTGGVTGGTAVTTAGGGAAQVGVFEDPFAFDLNGFNNDRDFTGADFFAGLDVTAIILEIPSVELNGATSNIAVWATTTEGTTQIDRIGRPAINTVLISGDANKDLFNAGTPDNDFSVFGNDVNAVITSLSSQANADALTPILLPDVLTFDTASAEGFDAPDGSTTPALNGRQLADDVIDVELSLLTEGALTTDMVTSNDVPFLNVFPYFAAANVPEPSSAALLLAGLAAGMSRRARRA